jgi:hypothetical protein
MAGTNNRLLSDDELRLIISALHAVSPSGGGSPTFTLARALSASTGVAEDHELTAQYCDNVVNDYREAMEG